MTWRARDTRTVLRWFHIVASVVLATYIYSPWQSVPAFDAGVRFVLIPLLAASGIWMWQQATFRRLIRRWRA